MFENLGGCKVCSARPGSPCVTRRGRDAKRPHWGRQVKRPVLRTALQEELGLPKGSEIYLAREVRRMRRLSEAYADVEARRFPD